MEKKTLGSFLTALRKANGMTQKKESLVDGTRGDGDSGKWRFILTMQRR